MCLYYRYNANHCLPLHFQSTKKHFIFIHPAFQLVYILFNNHFGYLSLLKGKYPTPKGQNQFSNKKKLTPSIMYYPIKELIKTFRNTYLVCKYTTHLLKSFSPALNIKYKFFTEIIRIRYCYSHPIYICSLH